MYDQEWKVENTNIKLRVINLAKNSGLTFGPLCCSRRPGGDVTHVSKLIAQDAKNRGVFHHTLNCVRAWSDPDRWRLDQGELQLIDHERKFSRLHRLFDASETSDRPSPTTIILSPLSAPNH